MSNRSEDLVTLEMKGLEHQFRTALPAKSFAVIRVDGKGFSKYTRGLVRPFDAKFTNDMRETALFLCQNIDGALFGYTQSDEISIVMSDLSNNNTQAWFNGQIQKIVSTSAGLASAKFNRLRPEIDKIAVFDGRTHTLPDAEGALRYIQWRQADAMKNSVGMLASHYFSHRTLQSVPVWKRREMLKEEHGVIWEDLDAAFKQGSFITRERGVKEVTFFHKKEKEERTLTVERNEWVIRDAPLFDSLESLNLV